MGIDQIILSTNEDETYINFWKPVAWAYKNMFPDARVHLAFLTNRDVEDELVQSFKEYGDVTLFKPVPGIPEFAQSKMIRFILASQQGDDVCYIDDIDLFPLRKDFITGKTDNRKKNTLLCVGGEVYHNNGCYPVSQMTAEGHIFKKFINPDNLKWPDLMKSYIGPVMFDRRENPLIELDFSKDNYFSDERLIRRLRHNNPVDIQEMPRGYSNYLEATLDRADWKIDEEKLYDHGYANAHCGRPFSMEDCKPLINYIIRNYALLNYGNPDYTEINSFE